MSLRNLLILFAFAVSAAFAQSWSQPVREVEKEARSAVFGACSGLIQPNANVGSGSCSMTLANGQSVQAVPAGKHLVVEDVSASCETASDELIAKLSLIVFPPPPAVNWRKWIPLANQGTTGSISPRTWRTGSVAARFYAPPGSTLGLSLFSGTATTGIPACDVRFAGHLVNVQ